MRWWPWVAAAFVIFSQLVPNDASPRRVAAQVVSRIGFLGAGIIFRDGFNVHGLNAAAVGLMAGIGGWDYALVLTALVVFVNLGLRPLVKLKKKHTKAGVSQARHFRLYVAVRPADEAKVRVLFLGALSVNGLHLSEITAAPAGDGGKTEIEVSLLGEGASEYAMERVVQGLASEAGFLGLRWQGHDEA